MRARQEMIPHFTIIIGAAKCGTSFLFHNLSHHPEICPSRVKEPNYFASEENFSRGRRWYESFWNWDGERHRTALEASTFYSVYPVYPCAPRNMSTMGAEFKFIYIVRSPLEQIRSHYVHALSIGSTWADPTSGWWTGPRINDFFLSSAAYARQLDEYRRYFSEDDLLVLDYRDLKCDPAEVLARICRFIGVDDSYRFRDSSKVVNPTAQKVVPRAGWNQLKRVPFLPDLYHCIPQGLRVKLHALVGIPGDAIDLTPDEKGFVARSLLQDLVRLRDQYGLNLIDAETQGQPEANSARLRGGESHA